MSDEWPAFIVRVQLRSTADGGRQTAIRSNYRPLFDIGNVWNDEQMLNDGRIMLLGADELAPGAEATRGSSHCGRSSGIMSGRARRYP